MPSLCQHRLEPLKAHSTNHPSTPPTCFNDSILAPLATWIYLFLLLPLSLAYIAYTRRCNKLHTGPSSPSHGATPPKQQPKTTRTARGIEIAYYVLIVVQIALLSLIIARLAVAQLGTGLLPFTYAGLITSGLVHWHVHRRRQQQSHEKHADGEGHAHEVAALVGANAIWWVLLVVMMGVNVASVVEEGRSSRATEDAESSYPWKDEITDKACIVGAGVVLLGLEVVAWSLAGAGAGRRG